MLFVKCMPCLSDYTVQEKPIYTNSNNHPFNKEITNQEKIEKITIIFAEFLISWGALALINSQILNVCKNKDLRFEKYCKDSYYISCLETSIFSKIFCHYSTLENTSVPFVTALGLTLLTNFPDISSSIKYSSLFHKTIKKMK